MILTPIERLKFERLIEQAKLKVEWLQGLLMGKAFERQSFDPVTNYWYEVSANKDKWHDDRIYRCKPSPRIEPFTFATCPLGAHVAWKTYKQRALVLGASENQVQVADCRYTYHEAMLLLWLIPDPSKPDERRPFGLEVS